VSRVILVHWREEEARPHLEALRAAGYEAEWFGQPGPGAMKTFRDPAVAAVVIDLSRLPSHGREVATALRHTKSTRHLPLVFVGGEPEKAAKVRALLPDAVYAEWNSIRGALKKAIASAPAAPVVPLAMMDRYSETPLWKKLGIKAGAKVCVLDAPAALDRVLGELPEGVTLCEGLCREGALTLWFVEEAGAFARELKSMLAVARRGPLWICYPKLASGATGGLTQALIREQGLSVGLVDFKVCSIDARWTGLCFRARQAEGARSTSRKV
jgi:CheY-like chemotaxis protein